MSSRRTTLARGLDGVRRRTFDLTDPLSQADLHRQHSELMSPLVWDMGHVANFEEYWLLRELAGHDAHDPQLDDVYNPFDNPRWTRANLPILDQRQATEYLNEVRREVEVIMSRGSFDESHPLAGDGYVFDMVLQHEAQHQDTVLQALDLRADLDPYKAAIPRPRLRRRVVDDEARVTIEGGTFTMGTNDRRSSYDNERPAHSVHVDAFSIDTYPVTARRMSAFIEAGGYSQPDWWSADGWAWNESTGHEAPQGWARRNDGGWDVFRFGRHVAVDPMEIVQHVSYWEAEAFCTWVGGRLPTEAEWEKAAAWDPQAGRSRPFPWGDGRPSSRVANLDVTGWGPSRAGDHPAGASFFGVEQLLGDTFEWTSSTFAGYPGFVAFPYKEYSEVFFADQYPVLRGAAWATNSAVARNTFRNWDLPERRQIFSGIRVAWDVS